MSPTHFTVYDQPNVVKPTTSDKHVTPSKQSINAPSEISGSELEHQRLMKQQALMDKADLAPDWVWEYGIMG
ncbi:MAG: hypothetical protein AAF959_21715 [Cyanobacteria bacterium P01_D01_bin.56]